MTQVIFFSGATWTQKIWRPKFKKLKRRLVIFSIKPAQITLFLMRSWSHWEKATSLDQKFSNADITRPAKLCIF